MAAPTYTVNTVQKWLASRLGDSGNNWLTTTQLNALIAQGLLTTSGTYRFNQVSTGWYRCTQLGEEMGVALLFATPTAPFAGTNDLVYEVDCMGSIVVTTGTHAATYIDVIGTTVDLQVVVPAACRELLSRNAGRSSVQVGTESIDMSQITDNWLRLHQLYMGVR